MFRCITSLDFEIDRLKRPAYQQILRHLAFAIESGDLEPGERLPPERDLALKLGVSRMTVRRAFDELARRRLVERGVGRGTFVSRPKLDYDHQRVVGFTEQMERAGLKPEAVVLEKDVREARGDVAAALHLAGGERVLYLRRLRSGGGVPLPIEEIWLPLSLFPGIADERLTSSLYAIMGDRYGRPSVRAVERLEPIQAPARTPACSRSSRALR